MGTQDQPKNQNTSAQKNTVEVTPVKKVYTTSGPHLDQMEDTGEARAALNEEMPSTAPRKDH